MPLPAKTRQQHLEDLVRRVVAADTQGRLTFFGDGSVGRALLGPVATAAEGGDIDYVEIRKRLTIMPNSGDALEEAARERGASDRLQGSPARVLAVVTPYLSQVTTVAVVSGTEDDITVNDGSQFAVSASIKIRYVDSTTGVTYSDTRTIASKPSANTLRVSTLTTRTAAQYNTAVIAGIEVSVLLRQTIPTGSDISSAAGVTFYTLSALTTGEANAALAGEGTALSLADKVWCEARTRGESGNIEPLTLLGFTDTALVVDAVYNPERGDGGTDIESEADLKRRAIEGPGDRSQVTLAWVKANTVKADSNVLRIVQVATSALATLSFKVLKRNAATFSAAELAAMTTYLEARTRSFQSFTFANVTLTSVEVEARITVSPGYTLTGVWKDAASRLATYLDFRTWPFGTDVDEAALLALVRNTPGVASLETGTFLPAADVSVGSESLPTLVRVSLEDTDTSTTINATLAQSF